MNAQPVKIGDVLGGGHHGQERWRLVVSLVAVGPIMAFKNKGTLMTPTPLGETVPYTTSMVGPIQASRLPLLHG